MFRVVVIGIIFKLVMSVSPVLANEAILNDVAKVKECWLKCPGEALPAGERALKFFTEQQTLEQTQIDGFATLAKYFTRVFYESGDYKRAESILEAYLSRSLTPTSENDTASIFVNRGLVYYATNQIVLAENAYLEALGILRKLEDKRSEGSVLNNLANLSLERGKVTQALAFYRQAIEIYENAILLSDDQGLIQRLSTTLTNLGIQLTLKGQFELAEEYILRAKDLLVESTSLRKKTEVAQAYTWLLIYSEKYEQALEYVTQNEGLIQSSQNIPQQAHYFAILGTIYEGLEQFEVAENAFSESIKLAKQVNARSSFETASLGLARLAGKRQEVAMAKTMLDSLLKSALELERYKFAETVQSELITVLSNDEQYEAAYLALMDNFESYRGRVKDEQENELSQYFALLETEEEKRKVVELERDNANQALDLSLSESRRQQALAIFSVIGLILLSIAVWLVQHRRIAKIQAKSASDLLNKKNELLAEISHDLRTPLSVLKLQIEGLEHDIFDDPENTYPRLHAKLESINHLIGDISQLALSDEGDLTLAFEPVNLSVFFNQWSQEASSLAAEKGLTFHVDIKISETERGIMDPERIVQVLNNVLANSCRYTDSPGKIVFSASVNDGELQWHIEDSAPGLTLEQLNQVFDRLYRADSSKSRESGGTGLGLSICKSLVEAHQGKIYAEQSELGGIAIRVSQPLSIMAVSND